MAAFFKGVKAEFNKVSWPTKDDIIKETVSVVVVTAILAALIALLDTGIQYGVNFISGL